MMIDLKKRQEVIRGGMRLTTVRENSVLLSFDKLSSYISDKIYIYRLLYLRGYTVEDIANDNFYTSYLQSIVTFMKEIFSDGDHFIKAFNFVSIL